MAPIHSPERNELLEQKKQAMDQPGLSVPASNHEFDRTILGLGLFSNLEAFVRSSR